MVQAIFTISGKNWGQRAGGHKRSKSLVPSQNLQRCSHESCESCRVALFLYEGSIFVSIQVEAGDRDRRELSYSAYRIASISSSTLCLSSRLKFTWRDWTNLKNRKLFSDDHLVKPNSYVFSQIVRVDRDCLQTAPVGGTARRPATAPNYKEGTEKQC
jgi:hypothetical protein